MNNTTCFKELSFDEMQLVDGGDAYDVGYEIGKCVGYVAYTCYKGVIFLVESGVI
ncbi:MAG: hypothetical protein K5769_05705 [Pseudobutyrivibrio sp.]|nr:hypothetical protein [Pseudobutyrivibrio sp.]